jgi:hypothetical protein
MPRRKGQRELSGRNLVSWNEKYLSIVQAPDVWRGEEQVPVGVVF